MATSAVGCAVISRIVAILLRPFGTCGDGDMALPVWWSHNDLRDGPDPDDPDEMRS